MENPRSRPSIMRDVLDVTNADNGQVEKNGTPLKNTSQDVSFKVVELQAHQQAI